MSGDTSAPMWLFALAMAVVFGLFAGVLYVVFGWPA